jgi:hypothetical protein
MQPLRKKLNFNHDPTLGVSLTRRGWQACSFQGITQHNGKKSEKGKVISHGFRVRFQQLIWQVFPVGKT